MAATRKTGAELGLELDGHTQPRTRRKKAEEEETVAIPAHLMDGMGEDQVYGTGLRLHIKALPIRYQAQVQKALRSSIPSVILMSAISDRYGRGVNEQLVTMQYNAVLAASHAQARRAQELKHEELLKQDGAPEHVPLPDAEPAPVMSDLEVRTEFLNLQGRLLQEADPDYQPQDGEKRLLVALAEAIWPLVKESPGVREEELPALLEEHLSIPDIVDLVRDCLNAYGPQPGSMFDRFETH